MNLEKLLIPLKDAKYKAFQEQICYSKYPIMGVRIPLLRKISKQLINTYSKEELLNYSYDKYYEIIMLEGFIIANINVLYNQRLNLIFNYLKKIDNWAICDIFCSELKFIKKDPITFLIFLKKIKKINKEYYQRFYIVILLQYYINDDYIDYVLEEILTIKSTKYYVNMALAWCLSICLVKYYSKTYNYLKKNKNNLNSFVFKTTIRKAKDSYRLTKKEKLNLQNI